MNGLLAALIFNPTRFVLSVGDVLALNPFLIQQGHRSGLAGIVMRT